MSCVCTVKKQQELPGNGDSECEVSCRWFDSRSKNNSLVWSGPKQKYHRISFLKTNMILNNLGTSFTNYLEVLHAILLLCADWLTICFPPSRSKQTVQFHTECHTVVPIDGESLSLLLCQFYSRNLPLLRHHKFACSK